MVEAAKELLQFLHDGTRADLKSLAVEQILGLTANEDGLSVIIALPQLLKSLLRLTRDKMDSIAKEATLCLVNVSANKNGATALMDLNENIVSGCFDIVLNPQSYNADAAAMILSNLTRNTQLIPKIIQDIETSKISVDNLMDAFTTTKYNQRGNNLHYLGPLLSNLSQIPAIRNLILDDSKEYMQKLVTFTDYQESLVRRGGVIGTLKNCCFDTDKHSWLLGDRVEILPKLLLPLADCTEFDDEDNDKLPLDLQFLPEDKKREEDPDIRCMLLEAITQLCAVRKNREYIREKNAYVILRELHKWEKDKKALLCCENLVDILIRTEDEIGEDDLKLVDVPDDVREKLDKLAIENENSEEAA